MSDNNLNEFSWAATAPLGLTALGAQCALTAFFTYGPKGPWKEEPGFSAQRAVMIPTMAFLASVGLQGWCFPGEELAARMTTPHGRIFGAHPHCINLNHYILGVLLIW